MTVAKKMALRMGIYVCLMGYLLLDLFLWKGPVYRMLNKLSEDREELAALAEVDGVVAKVYGKPIYKAQLEEALSEYLWRRGLKDDQLDDRRRRMMRELVLGRILDDELVKLQIRMSRAREVVVDEALVNEGLRIESMRFPDEEVYQVLADRARLLGEKERRLRVEARIQREAFLREAMEDEVTDEEAKLWYEYHQDGFEGDFETSLEEIKAMMRLEKRIEAWEIYRLNGLRERAGEKLEIFEKTLFEEIR